MSTSSEMAGRLAPPMRRVVTHMAPTAGTSPAPAGRSMCPSITPLCHSLNREGSVAHAKPPRRDARFRRLSRSAAYQWPSFSSAA